MCHDDTDVQEPWIDDENVDDILLLTENDIPGASLDGKHPSELNVTQLKRWLVCRGAPVNRKKPELVDRLVYCNHQFIVIYSNFRVCDYIKYGWDVFLIDPDGGANVQNKLQITATVNKKSLDAILLQSIPRPNDVQWSKHLYKAPKITFGSIYRFLVERKVLLHKANHLENIVDQRDNCTVENVGNKNHGKSSGADAYKSIGYTRTLDKAYRFFSGWSCPKYYVLSYAKSAKLCLYWCQRFTIYEER